MQKKPIRLTKHAVQRALRYDLAPEIIERIISEGNRHEEGKTKTRYVLKTKSGVWVAICEESPEQIIMITVTKGRR